MTYSVLKVPLNPNQPTIQTIVKDVNRIWWVPICLLSITFRRHLTVCGGRFWRTMRFFRYEQKIVSGYNSQKIRIDNEVHWLGRWVCQQCIPQCEGNREIQGDSPARLGRPYQTRWVPPPTLRSVVPLRCGVGRGRLSSWALVHILVSFFHPQIFLCPWTIFRETATPRSMF